VNDELQRRINEHVLNGDAPSIIWAMEGQIRINTELEAKLAELERRIRQQDDLLLGVAHDKANLRIELIQAERREALLTAFVVAEDAFNALMDSGDWDGDDAAYHAMMEARAALDWIPQP
jgi:hypothetical protein